MAISESTRVGVQHLAHSTEILPCIWRNIRNQTTLKSLSHILMLPPTPTIPPAKKTKQAAEPKQCLGVFRGRQGRFC